MSQVSEGWGKDKLALISKACFVSVLQAPLALIQQSEREVPFPSVYPGVKTD